MAKVPIALRLAPEDVERVDAYAKKRKVSRQVVLETFVLGGLDDSSRGVPDLAAEEMASLQESKRAVRDAHAARAIPGVTTASEIARRRANPSGMSRQARIEKGRGA